MSHEVIVDHVVW